MTEQSFIVMEASRRWKKTEKGPKPYYMCDVYAATVAGMEDFIMSGIDLIPGTTVNVEELGIVFRLKNDETWDIDKIYKDQPAEGTDVEEEVVAAILDGLIPDDEITDDDVEENNETVTDETTSETEGEEGTTT